MKSSVWNKQCRSCIPCHWNHAYQTRLGSACGLTVAYIRKCYKICSNWQRFLRKQVIKQKCKSRKSVEMKNGSTPKQFVPYESTINLYLKHAGVQWKERSSQSWVLATNHIFSITKLLSYNNTIIVFGALIHRSLTDTLYLFLYNVN